MMIGRFVIVMISVLIGFSVSHAAEGEWSAERNGWSVRANQVNAQRYWVLRHDKHKTAIITVNLDARTDLPFAEAFERLKTEQGKLNNCPALVTAKAEPERDLADEALLAITKVKDPEAYAAMEKDLPVIGYDATDDYARPRCVLIAREYVGGGVLFGWIGDDSGKLAFNRSYLSDIVRKTIDDINARETPQAPAETQQTVVSCEGTETYANWVMSWSPKSAIVYARNPEFLDADKSKGKKLRFGFNVGGKVDPKNGRQDLYYSIYLAAQESGQGFAPQKSYIIVDSVLLQKWGVGGGQWAALEDNTVEALFSGRTAIMETKELGRFRFPLADLKAVLELADTNQQIAVAHAELGMCEQ
ncbi:hypothetical protein [Hyphococcus sp.]|uniref:hypothetical protein n=1 Tax=Hyphococcus sp. TaxID=2038636 RepID=UPI0035C68DC0